MITNYTTKQVARFWSRVSKAPHSKGCWEWQGQTDKGGYGTISINDRNKRAHRMSYELAYGELPAELDVLHTCDNPTCVNPSHLFLGTDVDNMRDKVAKDRQCKGESHGMSKLTEEQVLEIRRRYKRYAKVDNTVTLAREFGVHQSRIFDIVNRKKWKHI